MDLKKDISEPASAKYTALENRMTPETGSLMGVGLGGVRTERIGYGEGEVCCVWVEVACCS